MLTADNLIPRAIQPPSGRVVTFWHPEDFVQVDEPNEPRQPNPQQLISEVMKANPGNSYCATDFAGITQKTAGTALRRLREKGLIVPSWKRHTGGPGGRQTQFYQWREA